MIVDRQSCPSLPSLPEYVTDLEHGHAQGLLMNEALSLALLEVSNLAPSFIVADACSKSANVRILGIESTDGAAQCIKLVGPIADVQAAAERGIALAKSMGSSAFSSILAAPLEVTYKLADAKPAFSPLLGVYDSRKPRENAMTTTNALGLLETQGWSPHCMRPMICSRLPTSHWPARKKSAPLMSRS